MITNYTLFKVCQSKYLSLLLLKSFTFIMIKRRDEIDLFSQL